MHHLRFGDPMSKYSLGCILRHSHSLSLSFSLNLSLLLHLPLTSPPLSRVRDKRNALRQARMPRLLSPPSDPGNKVINKAP